MKIVKHGIVILTALLLILGIPFFTSAWFRGHISGETDTLSGATVILDTPSGNFVVLINTDRHPDPEALETWKRFFAGEEISLLFEDVVCGVCRGDAAGLEMARSYQSRLPEHQMELRLEDPVLLLSKAEYGKFDILILSQEMADSMQASTVSEHENVTTVIVRGETE